MSKHFNIFLRSLLLLFFQINSVEIFGSIIKNHSWIIYQDNWLLSDLKIEPDSIAESIFDWFPLTIGNKWTKDFWILGNGCDQQNKFDDISEVLRDTIIQDKKYYQIHKPLIYFPSEYIRIDSSEGLVYSFSTAGNMELVLFDLNAQQGDTIYAYPGQPHLGYYVVLTHDTITLFGIQTEIKRIYAPINFFISFVKGFGIYIDEMCDLSGYERILKGCVINGIVYGDTNTVVGIKNNLEFLPDKFALHQNFPNPFNPSTVISYQLATAGDITLKVYDVLGREVAILVDEYKEAGYHEEEFKPESSIKNPASGVYYYQLRARAPETSSGQWIVETKKMILLR